jgi:radical SAM superfamily enzyme
MIDHHVVRLDVAVHDSLRMAKVERLQQLKHVKPYIKVGEFGIKGLEVGVLDIVNRGNTSACACEITRRTRTPHVDVFRHDRGGL